MTGKLGGAFGANLGLKPAASEAPSTTNVLGGGLAGLMGAKKEAETKKEEAPTAKPAGAAPKEEKKGTAIDFTFTFFPDKKMDDIVYYNTLHMFESDSWISIGFKPKAKDLKTIIEDLETMDYLHNIEDYETSVVLDGRKVRIGFEGDKLDPFQDKYSTQGE